MSESNTSSEHSTVPILGSESFREAVSEKLPDVLALAPHVPETTITVDAKGNVIGDTSAIDPNMLAQLQTPESQAQIAQLYRRSRYQPEPPRAPRFIAEGQRRDLRAHQPLPGRVGRRMLRQYLRKRTKIERQCAKGEPHGREPDQSHAGISDAGQ